MGRHPKNWQPPTTEKQTENKAASFNEDYQQENFNNMEQNQEQQKEITEAQVNELVQDIFASYGSFSQRIDDVLQAEKRLAEVSTRYGLLNLKFEQAKDHVNEDAQEAKRRCMSIETRLNSIVDRLAEIERKISKIENTPIMRSQL